jgi:hypothetical protein
MKINSIIALSKPQAVFWRSFELEQQNLDSNLSPSWYYTLLATNLFNLA